MVGGFCVITILVVIVLLGIILCVVAIVVVTTSAQVRGRGAGRDVEGSEYTGGRRGGDHGAQGQVQQHRLINA